jgi:bifunctional oligoribonuclease and PAP phosphatase NrnA
MTPLSQGDPQPIVLHSRDEAFATLLPLLQEAQTFVVTSHARPDGDAVGSALAAMHLLRAMGKRVTVAFADPIPRPFHALPGASEILSDLPAELADVALVLECDSVERTGFASLPGKVLVNIDHHHSGANFAAVNWIDPHAPAVGAMLYDLAVASGAPLTSALAGCLYAAVLTDTVAFTLPSTTAATFDLARHLLELGADAAAISDAVYFSQRESKLRLLGAVLRGLQVNGPVAWATVTRADMDATGAGTEDTEGIVQHIISVEGVQAAALLREQPEGDALRASLRSKGTVNVARVAEDFGGGGHRNASGCTVAGPLEEAARRVEIALQAACHLAGSTA